METLSFYITLQFGLLNAWIPLFTFVLAQVLYLIISKEGGKRAVDTMWYTLNDRKRFQWNSLFQTILAFFSFFIPLKIGTIWFIAGALIYVLALISFISAFQAYTTAPSDKIITKGIYRISRNPMYLSFNVGIFGICIASASLWIFILSIPIFIATHLMIKSEERYCENLYGQKYRDYKNEVQRYI